MLNFHIPGDRSAVVMAASRERVRLADKALKAERAENAGLKKELAAEREKSHSLEAQLTQAKAELLKAIQRYDLSVAQRVK